MKLQHGHAVFAIGHPADPVPPAGRDIAAGAARLQGRGAGQPPLVPDTALRGVFVPAAYEAGQAIRRPAAGPHRRVESRTLVGSEASAPEMPMPRKRRLARRPQPAGVRSHLGLAWRHPEGRQFLDRRRQAI